MHRTDVAVDDPVAATEFEVVRLSPSLGAEVRGVALAGIGPAGIAEIERLLLEHKVLFFPGQHLGVDDHVAFGRHFGPLEAHPNLRNPFTQHPELFELAASSGGIADEWHTDLTFLPSPSVASVLNMVRCPAVGGDTMWTNLELAYAELSAPMQALCDGLSAVHDATPHGKPELATIHPVVRVHPITGRRSLYVNEHFTRRIVELGHAESEAVLGLLTAWVHQERFTVRYRWSEGTIAMWDNRCTQHFVLNDFEGERIIQRVTIMGDRPEGLAPSPWAPFTTARRSAQSRHDRQLARVLAERD
jgi:taurine dioxygenase